MLDKHLGLVLWSRKTRWKLNNNPVAVTPERASGTT
jgi:hypothetical protein